MGNQRRGLPGGGGLPARAGCRRRGCLVFLLLAAAAAASLWLARAPLLRGVASLLVVSDEPARADLAIVHAGDRRRLAWGAELYRRGLARKILAFVDPSLEAGFFGLTGEEALRLAREEAEREGVAPADVVFVRGVTSTWEEGREAARYLREHPEVRTALVVSHPFHMRRIRAVYRHILPEGGPRLLYVPVPWERAGLSVDGWWTREPEVVWVQSEYVKLLFYHLRRFRGAAPGAAPGPPGSPETPARGEGGEVPGRP